MTPTDDPYLTIEKLLPSVKVEALVRGRRDPIWDMISRAEELLATSRTDRSVVASTIADWMTVRFGAPQPE